MDRLYLHGAPGGPGELAAFGVRPGWYGAEWMGFETPGDLAASLGARSGGSRLHVVGFSLGAMAALRLAAEAPALVGRIELISAAAPLELGDFLPRMAGRAVFRTAMAGGRRFRGLCAAQAGMARIAPGLMLRTLFAGAAPADAALVRQDRFRSAVAQSWRRAAPGKDPDGYARALRDYVQPWAGLLADVTSPVRLWHGGCDNWAPPDMAQALATHLPDADLMILPGLSHYSTLAHVIGAVTDQRVAAIHALPPSMQVPLVSPKRRRARGAENAPLSRAASNA